MQSSASTKPEDQAPLGESAPAVSENPVIGFSPAPAMDSRTPSLTLSLSRDVMKALLTITPGIDSKERLRLDDILAAGGRIGMEAKRFNPESLGEMIDAWNQNPQPLREEIVAVSLQSPQEGAPGRLEWLLPVPWGKPEKEATPISPLDATPTDSPKRDMREVKSIVAVTAGQSLVRVLPPGKGIHGEDLLGRLLPAQDGKPIAFIPGLNIEESPQEHGLFLAKKSGFLRLKDGRPEVQECFIVEGDVDYSTGNIRYDRSAEIRGDVQDGFGISIGGDLEIGGTVGDCRIIAGGTVLIHGGFQGKGQGILHAKSGVSFGFGSNQAVRAYGPIEVLKEAYNMSLSTREALSVRGPIVGGRAMAGVMIECSVAGNEHGTPTSLEVGFDFLALEGQQEVEARIKEYSEAQSRFVARQNALKEQYRNQKRMQPDMARELVLIRQALEKLAQAMPVLQSRRSLLAETLRKGLQRPGLQIRVEKMVHAGVIVKIGTEHLRLPNNVAGPRRFVLDEGRIKVF